MRSWKYLIYIDPDDEKTSFRAMKDKRDDKKIFSNTIEFILNKDNSVEHIGGGVNIDLTGDSSWTMIYDEGFEVGLGPSKFFFFNSYDKGKNSIPFI